MMPPIVSQITHIRTERLVDPRAPNHATEGNQGRSEHRARVDFSQLRWIFPVPSGGHLRRAI